MNIKTIEDIFYMASSSEIVTAHKGILRRDPIAGDFTHYAAWPTSMMIDNLVDSVEARDYIFPLVMLYDAVLGRRPDSAGLDFLGDVLPCKPNSDFIGNNGNWIPWLYRRQAALPAKR